MSTWPSRRASQVLAALQRIGWVTKRQSGSHRTLSRPGWPDFVLRSMTAKKSDRECWPESLSEQDLRRPICRGVHAPQNKGMKLTSAEHIERSQLIPGVRPTYSEWNTWQPTRAWTRRRS